MQLVAHHWGRPSRSLAASSPDGNCLGGQRGALNKHKSHLPVAAVATMMMIITVVVVVVVVVGVGVGVAGAPLTGMANQMINESRAETPSES